MSDATAVISALPRDTARTLAVEILLAEPESLGDDVLESCLYLLRERLKGSSESCGKATTTAATGLLAETDPRSLREGLSGGPEEAEFVRDNRLDG
jgi:hypothetical protein